VQPTAVRQLQDLVLAVALAVITVFETLTPFSSAMGSGNSTLTLVVALLACCALVVRRRWPLPSALVVVLCWPVVYSVTPLVVLFWGEFVPIVIALFSVARYAKARQGLIGGLAGVLTLLFFDLRVAVLRDPGEIVFHWMVCTVAWGLGWALRTHAERADREAARAVTVELTSRERALQAVADERARIARELHDIVAHSVSVMVVQAGAAEKASDDPAFVRAALSSIRTTGTGALAEMRRVVSLIRDDDQPAGLEPVPDLASLGALVAGMDIPTTLSVEGEERELSAGLALTAYRIVQEALTNIRRHARAATGEVSLRYREDCLEIEVSDDGRGAVAAEGGNGLIGMRERVQMYGGSLATVTAPGEGFRVRAVLPIGPPA
jgi:signal transduction histidine kinase